MDKKLVRVLVIDDDAGVRVSLGEILKAKGFEAIPAETGRAALALVERQDMDVALIDLRLEDMPGLNVLRGIKELSPDTECILLTGHATQDSAIEAVNLGAYSYYQKPFDIEQLLLSIRHAGERRAASRMLAESQARYQTFINATSDMAFLKDDQFRYILVNQANALFFGRPVEEIVGKDDFELMADEEHRGEEGARACRQSDQMVIQANNLIITNEEVKGRTYETRKFPVPLQAGRMGVGGYIRDITEHKKAQDELQQRIDDLEVLYESGLRLNRLLEPKEIGRVMIESISRKLAWHHAAIRLYHPETGSVEVLAVSHPGLDVESLETERRRLQKNAAGLDKGLSGWVIQHGRAVRSGNIITDKRYLETYAEVRSGVYVPIQAGDRTIGSIAVESESVNAFSEQDERILVTLASQAAVAFENARLFEQTARRAGELGMLANVSASLRMAITRAEMVSVTLTQASQVLHAPDAAVLFYDPAKGRHIVELAQGGWLPMSGAHFEAGEESSSQINQTRLPYLSADVARDGNFAFSPWCSPSEAVLGVPLLTVQDTGVENLTIGSLWAGRPPAKDQDALGPFTDDDRRMLSSIADMTANAIHRARLHDQAVRHADQMFTVNEIGRMLSETLDLKQINARLTGAVHNLLPDVCAVFISLLDESTQTITCASAHVDGAFMDVKEFPPLAFDPQGKGRQSHVLLTGEPLIVNNLAATLGKDPRTKLVGDPTRAPESALYVPMSSKGAPIGLIQVQSYLPDRFIREEVNLLSLVANTAAITIENARLFQAAQKELAERQRAEAELRTLNLELEERVQARTAELQTINAELARASRMKDEFLASMSHELRTPLTGIINLSEALQEQVYGALNEKQIRSLHTVEQSGQHLLGLINDILDLSKIEAGQLQLQPESFTVNDVCLSSLQIIKAVAQRKNQSVTFTIQPVSIELRADPRRLKQILVNLLSNAVKFTPEGGKIGLEVECNAEMQSVRFTVWDTGIGIAAEDLSKLFRPFTQLDSSLSRKQSGTGLGLTLVQRMVELHGGSVSLESVPGQGSRFSISLPWESADGDIGDADGDIDGTEHRGDRSPKGVNFGEEPASIFQHTPDTSRPLILLVDDNETNLMVYSDYLLSRGYRLEVAYNGQGAVRLAQECRPDLIIMDIQMPGMDGLEAIRQIRGAGQPWLNSTIILALTALAMPGDRERCLAAGADEYLSKPISLKKLESVIKELLSQPKRSSE